VYIRDFGAFSLIVEGKEGDSGYSRKPIFALHPKFASENNVRPGKNVLIPSTIK
jgi:hypothetical protein